MANHKSSEKRYRQTIKREERNRYYRTRVKNVVKAVTSAKGKEEANEAFKKANRYLHSMVSKGILKKNTAARKVSRLAAFIAKIA
ncbi:MAG: 30S ribosomal protein S20 [Helicobacteraceae bacterium]|jgi:small subunit ribosomal protein S20|nr:30S ribosomal protein S20 [Helicobacteraceae bacterium]MDR2033434.1 30S ribosomal protein S20 [Helicobacteraceae bacterium]